MNVIENGETKRHIGTYQHTKCSQNTTACSRCLNCQIVPLLKSFKLRLMRLSQTIDTKGRRDSNKIRHVFLTHKGEINAETAEDVRSDLLFLQR